MNILEIYKLDQTVFTSQELLQFFPGDTPQQLNNALHYAVKTGKLKRLRRGVYAKSNYSVNELANSIYIPSYISLETVLRTHGIIFQTDTSIQSVSYLSRDIVIEELRFVYRKIKYSILTNPKGLIVNGRETVASAERALLDSLMVFKNYHFDNLSPIDWNLVDDLTPIYQSKVLIRKIEKLRKDINQ